MNTPSLRSEASTRLAWLEERLDSVLPALMEREGIEAWVLAAREYNEDPVLSTMLPPTWMSTRRRTILVFTDYGRTRAAVARYDAGDAFPGIWDPDTDPDQWGRLARHLEGADPASIAINVGQSNAFADGLSASEHDAMVAALPATLTERLVASEPLAVGWLETRTASEAVAYREACRLAHEILAAGLSTAAVTPGNTTTADLEWWLRETVRDQGLNVWFHPAVSVQRRGGAPPSSFSSKPGEVTIQPGDLVHVDFGITHLGLCTDQQQHAYVVRSGEHDAPPGLTTAVAVANRLQDLVLAEFADGRTGNDILAGARSAAESAGIRPTIYSHPIGLHGHGAGPTIGLWDSQSGVPGAGDWPVHPMTAYSIELSAAVDVPEWDGQTVSIMLEEEAFFDGAAITWIDGRQTRLHIIG